MGKSREQIKEYREQLAGRFLEVLEERPLTWTKDWNEVDVPRNGTSGHVYRGINRLNLTLVSMARGYQDSRWMTYHQIQKKGWKLRNAKGQGVKVEYWFPYDRENKKYMTWEEFRAMGEDFGEQYLLLATYKTVFNGDLVEGIPEKEREQGKKIEVEELVGRIQKNMGVGLYNDGIDRAYYDPETDTVHLPRSEAFQTAYGYHATIFHELTHATGAPHRLNRDLSHGFGAPEYAFEELVAEISACFFSANLDIEPEDFHIQNHQAYVQSWAKRIKDRPETLVDAVRQAEKAAGYLEYQAELIQEKEYRKVLESSFKVGNQAFSAEREMEDEKGLFQGQKRAKKSALQSCMERTAQQKGKRAKSREQGR